MRLGQGATRSTLQATSGKRQLAVFVSHPVQYHVPLWRRLSALLMRPTLKEIRDLLDPAEYGGMPLIGINGTCIIAHGNSTPKAIKNAIQMAKRLAEEQVTERIQEDLGRNSDMLDVEGQGSKLWRQIRSHMSFRSERELEEDATEPPDDSSPSRISM